MKSHWYDFAVDMTLSVAAGGDYPERGRSPDAKHFGLAGVGSLLCHHSHSREHLMPNIGP